CSAGIGCAKRSGMTHQVATTDRSLTAAAALRRPVFLALLGALVALGAPASGCSGAESMADDESSALIAFLSGKGPEVLEGDLPARYGELLARHAVRASGYARAGVSAPGADGWSPIVVEGAGGPQPVDVAPWLSAGDIDATGHFTPCTKPCPTIGRLVTPPSEAELASVDERVARAAGAVTRLVGRHVEITWAPASERAILLTADGRAEVNPRLLQLVIPAAPTPATPTSVRAPAPAEERRDPTVATARDEIPEAPPPASFVKSEPSGPQEWGDGMGNWRSPCDDKDPCKCSYSPRGPSDDGPAGLWCTVAVLALVVARSRTSARQHGSRKAS
ncbi:MAG TPA: hypothetical protein PK141_13075, partial [Polyangiaceae bacterium]|nr:hypothetical protein [Polyangiaceae bacterium]